MTHERERERGRPLRRTMPGLEDTPAPVLPEPVPARPHAPVAGATAGGPSDAAMRSLVSPLLLRARLALLRPPPTPLVKKPDPRSRGGECVPDADPPLSRVTNESAPRSEW